MDNIDRGDSRTGWQAKWVSPDIADSPEAKGKLVLWFRLEVSHEMLSSNDL
jgi:hypothetical protein